MGIKSTVTSAVQTATGKIGGFVTAISTRTGAPKALVGTLMAATLVGTIGVGGAVMNNHEVEHNQYWVGDEECENAIQEEKKNSEGEVKIPESLELINDSQGVCPGPERITATFGYVGSWEGNIGPLDNLVGNQGPIHQMHEFYDANGGYTDSNGFERIKNQGDCYIVAVAPNPFAAPGCDEIVVGDLLEIYFDDGTMIEALIGDSKGWHYQNATMKTIDPTNEDDWRYIVKEVDPQGRTGYGCGWGHGPFEHNGGWDVNVLEFWGFGASGDPMSGDLQGSTGGNMTHVTSITNKGQLAAWTSFTGSDGSAVGAATANGGRNSSKNSSDAIDECKADRNYDNSTLAAALTSYSMSRSTEQADSEESSPIYQEVCDGVDELGQDDCTASYHYHSCDRGVAAAVYWTGADLSFPAGAPANQYSYCEESPLWEAVTEDGQQTDLTDEKAESMGLQPGDIGITLGDHILAYVGEDAVESAWKQVIKGLSGADVGEPEDGACMVSASAHTRGANIHAGYSDDRGYKYFRYKGDYPDKDKYKDLGSAATLSSTSVKGTDCDCLECGPEEEEETPSDIIAWAKEFEGQDYCWGGGHSAEQTCPDETPDGFHGPKGHSGAKVGYSLKEAHPCDCSGLVTSCYYLSGIDITEATGGNNATDGMQSDVGTFWKEVSDSEAQAGDIVLTSGHVMLYAGKNDSGNHYIIHEIYAGCSEEEVSAPSERGQVLHWIGPTGNAASGTDTTSPSTKKSANTGNEDCGQKCFDSGDFSDTFMVSDSVGAGAREKLEAALPGATMDLEGGRCYDEDGEGDQEDGGIDIARKQAGKYDRYIVEIGINDSGLTYDMAKEFVKVLGKSNTQVYFVNQYVTSNEAANSLTNESIDKVVSEYNNVFKIDWESKAKAHSEYLSDVCHLTDPDGTTAFADCVKSALTSNAGCTTSSNSDPNDHGTGAWHKNSMSMYTIADNDPPGSTATASGIPLDDNGLTCAIPMTTPNCSSYYGKKLELKIGDKTCTVTITDCGGFGSYGGPGGPRRIDATKGVFSKLGVAGEGLVAVEWRGVDLTEQQVNDLAA